VTRRNDLVVERRLRRKKRGGKRIRRVSGFSTPFLRGQIAEFRKKTKEKRERGSQRRDGGYVRVFRLPFPKSVRGCKVIFLTSTTRNLDMERSTSGR